MKNKNCVIGILLLLLFLLFIINMVTFITPKVYITTGIRPVTDKDYELFIKYSTVPLEKKTRSNCRYIYVQVKVVTPLLVIRNVQIERDTLQEYLYKSNSDVQFLGRYYSDGKKGYSDGIDVYSDGISDKKLKDIFKDYKIEVPWRDLWNGNRNNIYYLKDTLK
ncbi:MAG TPA: hypothetical protein VIK72_02525 [Clostridiaceae bacterium]